jgi:DNA-binding XRE family transcriptional regulator
MKFRNKGRMINTDCGPRLREFRESINETQVSFGEMVGLSENFIYKLETGRKELTLKTAIHICKACDMDFIWLLTGIKKP